MVRCLPHVLQRDEASAVGEEVPETGWHCLLHLGLREVAISLHLNMLTSWDEHRHQGTGWYLLLPKEFRQGLSSRQRVCDREQPVLSKNLDGLFHCIPANCLPWHNAFMLLNQCTCPSDPLI